MNGSAPAFGSLSVALAHATRLLAQRPQMAAEQAAEILKSVPGLPQARLILGQGRRLAGDFEGAIDVLEALARDQPRAAVVRRELGLSLSMAGRLDEAVRALRSATELKPDWPDAWRDLADHLDARDDAGGANQARAAFLAVAVHDPRLRAAATALRSNDLPVAESLLRAHLTQHETDVAALRMLAEIAMRLRRYRDAEALLERCAALAPDFRPAMHQYAIALYRQAKAAQALPHVEKLLALEPDNLGYLTLMAAVRAHLGETAESIGLYQRVLRRAPGQARLWLSYGHSLKTAGRAQESIDAYRRAIAIAPAMGEAYWSLANLKTFRFDDADVRAMRAALTRGDLPDDERVQLEFALGKALEDERSFAESFEHYARGAALRRSLHPYSAEENADYAARCKELFTAEFFARRAGAGNPSRDPIFILGMPRSGSTLVEQILASHPAVEGTMELPYIPNMAWPLAEAGKTGGERYPACLEGLTRDELRALGDRYLDESRIHRKTGAPRFIDKLPNNFLHLGFIHLVLPQATIIDTRRHPMACCFSNFKQYFARGQNFSYSLEDLGRFYRDYVELVAHFEAVLPGRVHRVVYEDLVADPPAQVRRLLDGCGLPFDERCLRFYENDRAVRTASSEQVRQPIFREGLERWKDYEPWLGPLRSALGKVLDAYPQWPPAGP